MVAVVVVVAAEHHLSARLYIFGVTCTPDNGQRFFWQTLITC